MDNKNKQLPTFAAFKANSQSTSGDWLAYQASTNEIKLIRYGKGMHIEENLTLDVQNEPVRGVRVVYSSQEDNVYVGIIFVGKLLILKKNQVIHQYRLKFSTNIVDFEGGFVGLEGINDGKQIYFVALTAKGLIVTIPVDEPQNQQVVFQLPFPFKAVSLIVKDLFAYIGTEQGQIVKADLNSKKIIEQFNSQSELPLNTINVCGDWLIVCTWQGQIQIVNLNLKTNKQLSAHEGMVILLAVAGYRFVTVGQDCIARVWDLSGDGTISEVKAERFDRRANLLVPFHEKIFVNFYEDNFIQEI